MLIHIEILGRGLKKDHLKKGEIEIIFNAETDLEAQRKANDIKKKLKLNVRDMFVKILKKYETETERYL